ncbi:MAG: beta-galactosidase trimerization domain-containing protein [Clostridia bacterium]|nr:beta-galactosidase trimerization domain-containing protein [Clostridia bacterium]
MKESGLDTAVILTNHIAVNKETSDILEKYVADGGVLITDGKFGITDELSMLNKELPGGEFNRYVGTDYIDTDYENLDFDYKGKTVRGFYGKDIVEVRDADILGTFADSGAAVTSRGHKSGSVISVNTHLWYGYSKT